MGMQSHFLKILAFHKIVISFTLIIISIIVNLLIIFISIFVNIITNFFFIFTFSCISVSRVDEFGFFIFWKSEGREGDVKELSQVSSCFITIMIILTLDNVQFDGL